VFGAAPVSEARQDQQCLGACGGRQRRADLTRASGGCETRRDARVQDAAAKYGAINHDAIVAKGLQEVLTKP
jgi:hypothetical protein